MLRPLTLKAKKEKDGVTESTLLPKVVGELRIVAIASHTVTVAEDSILNTIEIDGFFFFQVEKARERMTKRRLNSQR